MEAFDNGGRAQRRAVVQVAAIALCLTLVACSERVTVDNSAALSVPADMISALTCKFTSGHFAVIGTVDKRSAIREPMDFTFTDFDWKAGTALAIGSNGTAKVTLRRETFGDNVQFQFLEHIPTGSVALTTVFFSPAKPAPIGVAPFVKGTEASAVHSRHILAFGVLGKEAEAMVSQMIGKCRIKF